MSETHELLRAFFRKWSTTELTPTTRKILAEDLVQMRIMLEIYGDADSSVLEGCESARSREWFSTQYEELFIQKDKS